MPSPIASSNIVAQAFRFMELRPVSSVADGSPQAQAAAEQYPEALDRTLEAYDWSFARKLVTLPPRLSLPPGTAIDPDLPGLFSLPADCLVLRRLWPEDLAWRRDQGVVRTETTDPLTLLYTARQTNEDAMPPAFKTAVALELAVRLAPEWVAARTKREDLAAALQRTLRDAKTADAHTASHARLDGRPGQPDWALEARS